MRFESLQESIGNTPLVRFKKIFEGSKPQVYAKLEYLNPGGSIKDRIGLQMVLDAEKDGKIKSGGTLIECTSGNTGIGVAIAAKVKGYKCIFTMNDKQSKEKIDMLKAFGSEVIVCPTAVAPEDPRHYVQVAKKINREIPNSFLTNQYDNPSNWKAHYNTLGPELWNDTEGKITHFICGMGTGGTISGVGKYLKEKNKNVKIIGVDPIGSLYYDFFHTGRVTEASTYITEGIGEDFFPKVINWDCIDDVVQVSDKESFLMARRLAREEGFFAGGSSGSVVAGALKICRNFTENDVVTIILPDSGMRYLGKVFNDEWMRVNQFVDSPASKTISEIFSSKLKHAIVTIPQIEKCSKALSIMREYEFSQLPVVEGDNVVGTISEDQLITEALKGRDLQNTEVKSLMQPPLPVLSENASLHEVLNYVPSKSPAVLVKTGGMFTIITKYDLLKAISDKEIQFDSV